MKLEPTMQTVLPAAESRVCLWGAVGILVALMLAKALIGVPYIGALAINGVAFLQLYVPMWRAEKWNMSYHAVGLTWAYWRQDLKLTGLLCVVFMPVYALAFHVYKLYAHALVAQIPYVAAWAGSIPVSIWAPHAPQGGLGLGLGFWSVWVGGIQRLAIHMFGVALPEETFYRGYLQPCLEARWPPTHRWLGTPMGWATVGVTGLFALGHFIGEWQPLRLLPFFPGLVFAWQRNRTKTVLGAVAFHALCNVLSEGLEQLYQPLS